MRSITNHYWVCRSINSRVCSSTAICATLRRTPLHPTITAVRIKLYPICYPRVISRLRSSHLKMPIQPSRIARSALSRRTQIKASRLTRACGVTSLSTFYGEQALDYVSNFLQNHSEISATFSLTEETARLTSAAISLLNVHSNIDLLSFDNPHLSGVAYVRQDEQEMARTAVKLLREQMDDIYSPKNAVIPVQLIFP